MTASEIAESQHSAVKHWLQNEASEILKARPTHGKCAETIAISNLLFRIEEILKLKRNSLTYQQAQKYLKDAQIKTRWLSSKNRLSRELHNTPKTACDSCNPMLKDFGIKEILN